ncbi:MAG: hypothetical protein U9R08_05495 [Nanoarchaeota archaeon]|nr:hypothetical protein [Nanoarchaeota archaeon]
MKKKGVQIAWYYILAFIILFVLLIWFIFFSKGVGASLSEALKAVFPL